MIISQGAGPQDQLRMIGWLVVDGAEIAACDYKLAISLLHLKAWPRHGPKTPQTK